MAEIETRQDWIDTAKAVAAQMAEYMPLHGNRDPSMVDAEMSRLVDAEDWEGIRARFHEIWAWLPDRQDIHHGPFGDLCDLCSEDWALEEPA